MDLLHLWIGLIEVHHLTRNRIEESHSFFYQVESLSFCESHQ